MDDEIHNRKGEKMSKKRMNAMLGCVTALCMTCTTMSNAIVFAQDHIQTFVDEENKNVCSINGTEYASLKEAVEQAKAGETISLLSNVTEDVTLNKDIIIDGQDQYEIQGEFTLRQGTLQNLTITPNAANTSGSLLTLGSGEQTKIKMDNVTLKYSVTNRATGSAETVSGNKADITIQNCLFANEANNNGVTELAPEWSYELFVNEQADAGKITFINNEFNGAFRTMLSNSSGNMLIENNKFINSVFSVANGPTSGAAGDATSITTSTATNNHLVIRNNEFNNAGSIFFQTQIEFNGNKFITDKFENYIQAHDKIAEQVDLRNNSFETGNNDLIIFDKAKAPILLPAGQEAVCGWVYFKTPDESRPNDYSDYKYMYNQDGTITFKPQSDVALDQFLNQNKGNIQVGNHDTVLIEKDLKIDTLSIDKDTNINFEIQKDASLEISKEMNVSGSVKIDGEGKFKVAENGKLNINEDATLGISKDTTFENNGEIKNDGTFEIIDAVTGGGSSSQKEELNPVYRAYNPGNGEHLYTTNEAEYKRVVILGWHDEGIAFMAQKDDKDGLALYRLYNPNEGLHHYTQDEKERTALLALGWKDEGIAWYTSKKPMHHPVYRLYNPNDGHHHYTMDGHEKDVLVSLGWNDEGVAFRTAPIEK